MVEYCGLKVKTRARSEIYDHTGVYIITQTQGNHLFAGPQLTRFHNGWRRDVNVIQSIPKISK